MKKYVSATDFYPVYMLSDKDTQHKYSHGIFHGEPCIELTEEEVKQYQEAVDNYLKAIKFIEGKVHGK